MYNIMVQEGEERQKTIGKFKFVNKWLIIPLYRAYILPLFGMGWYILLLYTIGRKTGKQRITPLEYRKYEGDLLLFSSRGVHADWFKNLKTNPDKVKIKRGFSSYCPKVDIINDVEKRIEMMKWYAQNYSFAAKFFFGYNKKEDKLSEENMRPMMEFIQIVRLIIPC